MKIWIFNQYTLTPDQPGGTRHYDFSIELINRGHEVSIFSGSINYSTLKETKKYSDYFLYEKIDAINFYWIKTILYRSNIKRVFNMLEYSVKSFIVSYKLCKNNKPDIIIGSSVHLFAVLIGYIISKTYKIPFIMEVRDLWPLTLIEMGISKYHPFILLLSFLEKYLYKRASIIITLLPNTFKYIQQLNIGVSKDKIIWISNGVNIENISNKISMGIRKKELKIRDNNEFIISYTGTIGIANSIDKLIEAAAILLNKNINIKIIIVGDGPLKESIREKIEKENIHNVFLIDPVNKKDIFSIFEQSDVLFVGLKNLKLYKYGISLNKIFDYMASGKPIIFASESFNNPIEDSGAGITVNPENSIEIAEGIIKMFNISFEEREKMGNNGYNYVKNNYSIKKLTDNLESMLIDVKKGH